MSDSEALWRDLHDALRESRAAVVSRLDGLSEADRRRPLTASGTNLLGLVKHLAGIELGYLGDSFGRPPEQPLPWVADGSVWDGADMWATAEEPSEDVLGAYRAACAHADATIEALSPDTVGRVPWWPEDRSAATLGALLVRVLVDTARHAGQGDIVRELVDGRGGEGHDALGDEDWWEAYRARIDAAAATFEERGGDPVRVVRRHDLQPADPTPGMARERAFEVPVLWSGQVRTEPGAVSGWHHHDLNETSLYVVSGTLRLEVGHDEGYLDAHAGDFVHVPAYTVHRESNPTDEPSVAVIARAGGGVPTVNVDPPAGREDPPAP